MRILLDTCALIHLHSGGVLQLIFLLDGHSFAVCEQVRDETLSLQTELEGLISRGSIEEIADASLGFTEVVAFADQENLGVGETECILLCQRDSTLTLCSSDNRARRIATQKLGSKRIFSVHELLLECISQNLLSPFDACSAYRQIIERGAYLPHLSMHDFAV